MTTLPPSPYKNSKPRTCRGSSSETGAGNEARTRDLNLGKVALYQLSYSRPKQTRNCRAVPPGVKKKPAEIAPKPLNQTTFPCPWARCPRCAPTRRPRAAGPAKVSCCPVIRATQCADTESSTTASTPRPRRSGPAQACRSVSRTSTDETAALKARRFA